MSHRVRTLSAVVLAVAVTACAGETPLAELKGPCSEVYKAQVCTWAKMQGKTVTEVGALVPMAVIENAPVQGSMDWPPVADARLDVPEAARAGSGLTQLTVYWEAMGHPPGPYLTPHFDFHFYTVAAAEQDAIDCKDLSKPTALPAGYALPDVPLPPDMAKMIGVPTLIGLCVPKMGMHSLLASELDSKDPFRGSMVVGYYGGKPIFIEPMLTKAMLMEKKSFDLPVAEVPGLGAAHPTKFHAEFDAATNSYKFIFSGFPPVV